MYAFLCCVQMGARDQPPLGTSPMSELVFDFTSIRLPYFTLCSLFRLCLSILGNQSLNFATLSDSNFTANKAASRVKPRILTSPSAKFAT